MYKLAKRINGISIEFHELVRLINSVLVFLYLILLIVGSVSSITSLILLVTIIALPTINFKELTKYDYFFFVSWLLFGLYHASHIYILEMQLNSGVEKYLKFIAGALYYLMIRQYGLYEKFIYFGALIGGAIASFFVMYQVYGLDYSGRVGLGHNPISFGTIMCLYAAIAMCGASVFNNYMRYFFILASFVFIIMSFYSGTRNLYFVYVLLFLYFLYLNKGFFYTNIFSWRAYLFLMLVFLSILGMGVFNNDMVEKRFENTYSEVELIKKGDLSSSFGQRLQMWDAGIYLFKERPVFGHGENRQTLSLALESFLEEKGYFSNIMIRYSHFHNSFIDHMAKFGLIGLILYILIFYFAVKGVSLDRKSSLLIVVLLIYIIGSFTNVPFSQNRTMMTFIIMVVCLRARCFVKT
ncbi:O-antigen ligase family protein [Nitrincola schmidtii]|uniref:O-antigen ligase family protein n=1 Tax=Nitrincola schmidtii TaxID=1730894 RepID=UPI001456BFF3|nr:O-antigen ligase family protein [Nitrincola schmidtii]